MGVAIVGHAAARDTVPLVREYGVVQQHGAAAPLRRKCIMKIKTNLRAGQGSNSNSVVTSTPVVAEAAAAGSNSKSKGEGAVVYPPIYTGRCIGA